MARVEKRYSRGLPANSRCGKPSLLRVAIFHICEERGNRRYFALFKTAQSYLINYIIYASLSFTVNWVKLPMAHVEMRYGKGLPANSRCGKPSLLWVAFSTL